MTVGTLKISIIWLGHVLGNCFLWNEGESCFKTSLMKQVFLLADGFSLLTPTRSDKRGLKSLGPKSASGKDARDNHCVLHLVVMLQPTWFLFLSERFNLHSNVKLLS